MLVKDLCMQHAQSKLIAENDDKQELNKNRDVNSRKKVKSGNNKKED